MAESKLCLFDLPTEILVSILSTFETRALLPLVLICRRFHSIILRILHLRLLVAAQLPEYKLILEAYHPSRKYTDPYYFCTYLGTDGLSSTQEGEGSLYHDCKDERGRLAKLGTVYSRFRPERPGVEGSMPVRRIAGATPAQSASGNPIQPIYANAGDGGSIKVVHTINLDADELFGQFCAYSSLVRLGPRRGVFLSTVPIVETGQGVMRVWREWLITRARELRREEDMQPAGTEPDLQRSFTMACPNIEGDKSIIWTDYRRNVGLRIAVRSRDEKCHLNESDDLDDLALGFNMEIQELVVRTTHLMLAIEASTKDQYNRSGRALIFGNFATVAPGSSYSTSRPAAAVFGAQAAGNESSEASLSSSADSAMS